MIRCATLPLICLGTLAMSACIASAAPVERKTLEIGAPAPDFDLPSVEGRRYRLADFADARVLVVIFTCNHCPTAQAYEDRIMKLHKDYKDRGVALVAISPNDPQAVRLDELGYTDLSDSLEEMKIRAKDRGFQFPYLYDGETQQVSTAFGVRATPHVFIFDEARKLRYVGRIDDSDVRTVESHDARNALEALLAGRPVPVESTPVFGCSTKWSEKRESARESIAKWDQEPVDLERIESAGVRELAANKTDKTRLVNVWATWCGPCVAELAELTTIHRMYRRRKFEVVTISADGPDKLDDALETLKESHLSCKNYLYNSDDRYQLVEDLDKEWPGPVPYTLLIAPGGEVLYRHDGPFDPLELKKAIADHLGRTYASRRR